ncbi:small nuclear ribonucleoprotein Sm D1 isoform X2 [Myotis lucifugus]|uniref:small nuclear ribonucleoprotein Sm D1 isoform X2 n=1 Tax=Myotis lucifugus TaxID=59463 RepID=UPI000CCC62BF|nr:small nuclear ribonucleoprotein Sm D1 isoform X2 [Myotis lucifugus]
MDAVSSKSGRKCPQQLQVTPPATRARCGAPRGRKGVRPSAASAFPLCVRSAPRALYVGGLGGGVSGHSYSVPVVGVVRFCALSDRNLEIFVRMKLVRCRCQHEYSS